MAVGGMIGGGIFSVLGVAITLAGHLAVGCFVVGAGIAAVTARSFAGVTARAGRSGGPFDHLRETGRTRLAGMLVWLIGFGYVVAMAVYSFTFGRYAANALGAPTWVARMLAVAIVAAFFFVNLRGVRVSSRTEDLIVAIKLVVLGGIAVIGIAAFAPDRLSPPANEGVLGLFVGAATVFFAYEGFELISFDRGDMVDPERTLPRSMYLAVGIVAAVYVGGDRRCADAGVRCRDQSPTRRWRSSSSGGPPSVRRGGGRPSSAPSSRPRRPSTRRSSRAPGSCGTRAGRTTSPRLSVGSGPGSRRSPSR